MGKKASPAPTVAAAPDTGPKVTMLDAAATAKKNVRKKRAPLSAIAPTVLGADKLGASVLSGAMF